MSIHGAVVLSLALALPIASAALGEEGPFKTKAKGDRLIVRDKSKPVRKALELQYARLADAVENQDHPAFQALRTADFHTVDEQGREQTAQQMSDRARAMLASIRPPIEVRNTIGTIDVRGETARATVRQYFSKMLELAGELRRVETWVTQDETWTLTDDGWKLSFVDGVRDGEWYVDGKRIDPGQPYDAEAPPYDPQAPASREERPDGRPGG